MATIRDMIPAFGLFQPTSVEDALELVNDHGRKAWVLAGGLDSMDWFKDRIKRPEVVIDLGAIDELRGVRETGGALDIGALTTLTALERHDAVQKLFPMLAEAARHVATPQIRNQGTLGGNLSQDTRCWYYRSGWPCYRAGGNTCYASAPQAMNREHCILGASRCVAVNPSDTAPALIALDAKMVIRDRRRTRTVDAEDYFVGPAIDITRMTVLKANDLLTSVHVPSAWAGAQTYYEKVRDRGSWDFSLVTVAGAFWASGGRIEQARIVVNGVAAYPVRLHEVERAVIGAAVGEETARAAGDLAVQGAKPLRHNEYKVALMRNLVRRAVRSVA
ncbi:MAG TPA: xanthine dehydrogenase family protein subunit M [Longimicrobiales bacterium]|nr:xanthine dehydrogenase family protein subunit M [Longimicrobiales bacterium]